MMKNSYLCSVCGADVTNGVGPSGLPIVTKFLQVLPSSHLFYMPACYHDIDYHLGATELHRKLADEFFLQRMLIEVKSKCKWYEKPWYKISAYRNYWFVCKFGSAFFNYKGCK
jgi:hypothetical protein